MIKKEKINIDTFRLIASFVIVAIHIYPFTFISNDFDYIITRVLFRIAVPLFLMITGYYVISKSLSDINVLNKYTVKILKYYLISIIIFLPINIYNHYFLDNSFISIIKDILINGTFYHLWYFPALILGLYITYYLVKYFDDKTTKTILLLLFITGLFGDNYYGFINNNLSLNSFYNLIFNISDYTRNGLFYTPIFLYMGYKFKNKTNHLTYKKNITYLLISLCLMLIEGYLLYHFNIPRHSSMYIFLLPTSYFIFNLLIFNYKGQNKNARNYSTWIYILHPLFIVVVRLISKFLHFNILVNNSLINYILVLLSTLIFIVIIDKVKEVIKNDKRIINK